MRRDARMRKNENKNLSDKIIMYSIIGVGILTAVLVGLLIYSKNLSDSVKEGTMSLEQMASIAGNNTENGENTESASTEIGKTVEESKKEANNANNTNATNSSNSGANKTINANTQNSSNKAKSNTSKNANSSVASGTSKATNTKTTEKKEVKKELSFAKPVDGEIMKEYAKDNLVYSETLKEWVTHLGIDIRAEKTTVVKAAEVGTIKSIKNDPRYGLTIVIDHGDGFESIYANLLTSEFVVEGEKIEKGQSIGTVGNTAVFEIADEAHLHFEIRKDSIQVDPNIYVK